ncbi:MAG TPA: hypothetical protein VMW23_09140 [Sedimentisphaerales bacterium]|nr:hypothetical protein [Sedimentisphaerales bacterium]
MTTSTNNKLLAAVAVLACAAVLWLVTSIHGRTKIYEIDPTIASPEYRTDAARAIDAYENLMQRYLDITENNLVGIAGDVKNIVDKLNSIDSRLAELSVKIERIEKALAGRKRTPAPDRKPTSTDDDSPQDTENTLPVR